MVIPLRSRRYRRLGWAMAASLTFALAFVVHQRVHAQFTGTCPAANPAKCQACDPFNPASTQCFIGTPAGWQYGPCNPGAGQCNQAPFYCGGTVYDCSANPKPVNPPPIINPCTAMPTVCH